MELLIAKELALHNPEIRSNEQELRNLLHPGFIEIGYSGKTWDLHSVIESLIADSSSKFNLHSQQFECTELQPGACLLLYKTVHMEKDGSLSRFAKRTSIWMLNGTEWQMRFHQATACESFAIIKSGSR